MNQKLPHQPKKEPAKKPAPGNLENCRRLLLFLETSFCGATIGDIKMDDMTNSLKKILAVFAEDKETRPS